MTIACARASIFASATNFKSAKDNAMQATILSETHGKRYAVIVNEFGEVGIDNDLIVNAEEEIFEMNNGCICCTVRGDLIRILVAPLRHRSNLASQISCCSTKPIW
jgi:hypothetical protein